MKQLPWRIRRKIQQFLAGLLVVVMTVTSVPIPTFAESEYANYLAGWKVMCAWSNLSADYEWNAGNDEIRQPKLIFTYRLEHATRDFAPGELTFTIPGIGNAYRDFVLKADKLVTDSADSEWDLTWDEMTDTYVYTNRFEVKQNESINGGLEMMYTFQSRENVNDYVQELIPEFSVNGEGRILMPPLTYSFTSVRDRYRIDMTRDKITSEAYDASDKSFVWYEIETRFDKDWLSRALYKSRYYVTIDLPDGEDYADVIVKNGSKTYTLTEDENGEWGFYPFKDRRGNIGTRYSTYYDTFTVGFSKESLKDAEVTIHGHLDRLYEDESEWVTEAGENEVVDDELTFTVDDYAFTHEGYIYSHNKTGQYSSSTPYPSRLNAVNLYNGKVVQFQLTGRANRSYASTFSLKNRRMMAVYEVPVATPSDATPSNAADTTNETEEIFLEDGFPALPEGVEDWNNIHWKEDGLGTGSVLEPGTDDQTGKEDDDTNDWGIFDLINDLFGSAKETVSGLGEQLLMTAYAATPSVPEEEQEENDITPSIPKDDTAGTAGEPEEDMDIPALFSGTKGNPVATYPGGNTSGISRIGENQEYSLVLGDDKLAVFLEDGSMRALEDEEYDIAYVTVPAASRSYDFEVYGAATQDTHFDNYVFLGEGNTGTKSTVLLPEGVKAVYVKVNGITGSFSYDAYVGVRFHLDWESEQAKPEGKRISHENRVVNFSYLRALYLTEEDGLLYEVNDCATTEDEYTGSYGIGLADRDLAVYSEQLMRDYSNVYLRSPVTKVSADTTVGTFNGGGKDGFTTTVTSSGTISADNEGPLERFSLYSVLPDGFVVDMDEGDITLTGSAKDQAGNEVTDFLDHAEIRLAEYNGKQMIAVDVDYSLRPLAISEGVTLRISYPASLSYADYLGYGNTYTVNTYVLVQDAGTDKVSGSAVMTDQYDIDEDHDLSEKMAFSSDTETALDDVSEWREFVSKYVKNAYSDGYVTDTVTRVYNRTEAPDVQEKSLYSYRLDFGLGSSNAKEIVFFDAIEQGASIAVNETEGVYEEIPSEWQGTLVSVDTSHAESQGMIPTVYYSTDGEQTFDLTDAGWTTEPEDMDSVKTIAVHLDTSELPDGMLKTKQMTYITLHMQAPEDASFADKKAVNQYTVQYDAYGIDGGFDTAYTLPSAETYVTLYDSVGKLTIQKVDLDNQTGVDKDGNPKYAPLTGTRFQVYDNYDNPLLGPEGKEVNSLGQIVIKNLPHGTYFYEELEAPAGYEKINGQKPFVIDELHEVLTIGNRRIPGSVSLTKEDSTDPSNGLLAGAVFELYREDGTQVSMNEHYMYDESGDVWEIVTAGSGWTDTGLVSKTANVIDANTSNGTYASSQNVCETITVPGAEKLEVTITYQTESYFDWVTIYDGTVTPSISNTGQSIPKKKLYSSTRKTETYEIAGDTVQFLFYSDNSTESFGYYATIRAYMNGGRASVSGLPWGNYYFLEKQAPQGYELDTEKIPFTVGRADYDETTNKVEVSLSTGNSQLPTSVQFVKKDAENGAVLKDAYYDVFKEQEDGTFKKVKENLKTNAAGEIYIENLYFGSYEFREVQPPKGYQLNPDPVPFVLDAETAGTVVEVEQTDARKTGSARLHKTSEDGMPLAGAVYGLFKDGEETPVAENLVTDADGFTALVDGLTWSDGYYFKEITAPKGYELDESEIRFGVNAGNTDITQTIYASDKRMQGSVKLTKMDEKTKSLYLEGAEFALYKTDGTLVRDGLITGNDGTVTVESIDWGSFYLLEKKAPQGFVLSEEKIRFSVNQENCHLTQEVTCYNKEATGSITIEKEILGGERYQPFGSTSFTFVVKGINAVTGEELSWHRQIVIGEGQESGTAVISDVPYGSYTIREISNSRYRVSDVTAGSANVTVSETGAVVNLSNDEAANVIFTNDLTHYEKDSQMAEAANIVTKGRKLTGISVEYKGDTRIESDTEAEYTFTAADLAVIAFYDDGTTKDIPFEELTLDPSTITGNQNTSGAGYTVEVSYEENGIKKSGNFSVEISLQIPKVPYTVTYNANGGYFGTDTSMSLNEMTYRWEEVSHLKGDVVQVSSTFNVTDLDTYTAGYGPNRADTKIITIPGAESLYVKVTYETYNSTTDWVSVYKGKDVVPSATNYNHTSCVSRRLGGIGGNGKLYQTYSIPGDTVQFFFKSDDSYNNYFGYYATVSLNHDLRIQENVLNSGAYAVPQHLVMKFDGWYLDEECTVGNEYEFDPFEELTEDITVYAKWRYPDADLQDGKSLSVLFKRLSGQKGTITYDATNSTIKAIRRSEESPDISAMNSSNRISSITSEAPVYAWFDATDGTIYWWSSAKNPLIHKNADYMFYGLNNLADISGLADWNAKQVSDMTSMFYSCSSLTNLEALKNWNPMSITNMRSMFRHCTGLTSLKGLENWTISKVQYLDNMFYNCKNLTSLEGTEKWRLTSATQTDYMFYNCNRLTSLKAAKDWTIYQTTRTDYMFYGCSSLTSLDGLENWRFSYATEMISMFEGCSSLTSLEALSNWTFPKVEYMYDMFEGCSSLTSLKGLEYWRFPKATWMSYMFRGCSSLTSLEALSNWTFPNVQYMQYMFEGCSSLTSLAPLSNWTFPNVTNMSSMFEGCSGLTNLEGLENWTFPNVTVMYGMFYNCRRLTSLEAISGWTFPKATSMSSMFYNCSNLTNLEGLENWTFPNVTSISYMFSNCSSLTNLEALSNWTFPNVTDMSSMFDGCNSLVNASALDEWNITNVSNFKYIFYKCSSLTVYPAWNGTWNNVGTFNPN